VHSHTRPERFWSYPQTHEVVLGVAQPACRARQHQPHFDTTTPDGHSSCKLDWAVARVLRLECRDCPAQECAAPDPNRHRLLLDDNLLDEVSNDLGSFRW
jgi:hypothetical protein